MKKLKKFMFSPKGTLVAFGAAMVLLLLSSIGGARAALTYYSDNHMTEINTRYIGVSLMEGKDEIAKSARSSSDQIGRGTLQLPEIKKETGGKAKVGALYAENLSVENSGEIDQYVRVTVYKCWEKGGASQTDLYPGYIELGYADGWKVDTAASTQERTVLYYMPGPLAGSNGDGNGGPKSVPFVNSIRISPEVSKIVDSNGTYSYQGCDFKIEVEVDAVQTHNASDAILSAWGKTVTVNGDGSLAFN